MSQQWYCQIGGREHGPMSPGEIKKMAVSGRLKADDLVRTSDQTGWTLAGRVRGLTFGTASHSGVAAGSPEPGKKTNDVEPLPSREDSRIQILYEKSGEPVAAFVRRRYDDCLGITDQKLLKLFATAVKIHAWVTVQLGGVQFQTVSAVQTLPLKSPQLESVPLIPLRSADFEYLDGPSTFFEKVHIIGDSDNDKSARKFLRPGFYFSARYGGGTLVSYERKIWIIPAGLEQQFLHTLKTKGARAFESLESFPDPTSPFLDQGAIRIPGDQPPNPQNDVGDAERPGSDAWKWPAVIAGVVIGLVALPLGVWGWMRMTSRTDSARSGVVAGKSSTASPSPQPSTQTGPATSSVQVPFASPLVPSTSELPSPPAPPSQPIPIAATQAVDRLLEKIDREASGDLTEWMKLRQDFLVDKSTFSAVLAMGAIPMTRDEVAAIQAAGQESLAVARLREVINAVVQRTRGSLMADPRDYFRCLLVAQSLKQLGSLAQPAVPELQQLAQASDDPILQSLAKQALEAAGGVATVNPTTPGPSDDVVLVQMRELLRRLPAPASPDAPQRFITRIQGLPQEILDGWAKAFQPVLGEPLSREEAFQFLQDYDHAFVQDRYQPARGRELMNRLPSLGGDAVTEWCASAVAFSPRFQRPGRGERLIMLGLVVAQDSLFNGPIYDGMRALNYRQRLATITPAAVRRLASQIKPLVANNPELTVFELDLAMSMLFTDCLFLNDRFHEPGFERALKIVATHQLQHDPPSVAPVAR